MEGISITHRENCLSVTDYELGDETAKKISIKDKEWKPTMDIEAQSQRWKKPITVVI